MGLAMGSEKITNEVFLQFLLLGILIRLGGSAKRDAILKHIERNHKSWLSNKDLEVYASGSTVRWENHISFARQHLIDIGYMRNDSPRGIWEITDEGRKWFTDIKLKASNPR